MLRNRIYYWLKPALPRSLRLQVRRWLGRRIRRTAAGIWPVLPGSEQLPENWPGWPRDKKFAVVLTHDVEGPLGLQNCRALMELEQSMGFVSSFNFIPEGTYRTPPELRDQLTRQGFEIGIHDLHHDGFLYRSRPEFIRHASRINHYLAGWAAVGFRSGFMLRELDWLHDLNILYDASTFDTDPFEPQPQGAATIFPYLVTPKDKRASAGYVELPYTLPQDSTLFLILQENTPDIWLRKIDWIARHGGLVLVNIHPDYVDFASGGKSGVSYPVAMIRQLLDHLLSNYKGSFWNPLPRELAAWYRDLAFHAPSPDLLMNNSPL